MFGRCEKLKTQQQLQQTVEGLCGVISLLRQDIIHVREDLIRESNRADRMADRLIEMTMIVRGNPKDAIALRQYAVALAEQPASRQDVDDWGQPQDPDRTAWFPAP